jgi:polyhydroxyalkanoate synthesis regulator phasin
MRAKSVLYAAVGAPVVAARKVSHQVTSLREQVSKETASYSETANKAIDEWAAEGEKVLSRISEGKVVEEISQKVDLDQAKEQVSKLRDQLEDMLDTWRHSFRPEKPAAETAEKAQEKPAAAKPAAKKPAAKSGASKKATGTPKSTAKKTSAAKTTSAKSGQSSVAAKASSEKTEAAKAKAS